MIYEAWKQNCLSKGISSRNIELKNQLFDNIIKDIDQTNKKLLLVGSVQSGKTATYMGLIAKLFEQNSSNFVVLFCGISNILKRQTLSRFTDAFKTSKDIAIHTSEPGEFDYDPIIEDLRQGKKVLLISIKHYLHIDKIATWFNDSALFFKNPFIIDDEGDQASFYNLKKYSQEGFHSATYRSLCGFFKRDNACTFMSVTATPYAHIIAHKEWYSLTPDFVYMIPEGEQYLSYNDLKSHDDIFKLLNENDFQELEIEKDELGHYTLLNIPFSLKCALIHYLISHSLYSGQPNYGGSITEMIINIDKRIAVHWSLKDRLQEFLQDFEYSPDLQGEVIKFLYPSLSYEEQCEYVNRALSIIQSDDLEFRVLNCSNTDEKTRDIEDKNSGKHCNIVIGGLTIARGVSFPTLLSFYYMNDKPKIFTMDNVIQVCRFLGYRQKEINYYSLWFTSKIQMLFDSIFDADEWVREKIVVYQRNHWSFKNFVRAIRFRANPNADFTLIATRQTIAKQIHPVVKKTLFNDASFDFRSETDANINNDMLSLLNYYISKYLKMPTKNTSETFGPHFAKYPIIEFANFNALIDDLKQNGFKRPEEVLSEYYKVAVDNKDIVAVLKALNYKIVVALMVYDFDNTTGTYTSKNIHYLRDIKEFSYYRQGYRVDYIGDNNWSYEIKKMYDQDVIFVQLFVLNTPKEYKVFFRNNVVKMQIILPTDERTEVDQLIIAEDEPIGKIETDIGFGEEEDDD